MAASRNDIPGLPHLEFLRTGIALVPAPGSQAAAVRVTRVPGSSGALRSCTCKESRHRTCEHLKALGRGVTETHRLWGEKGWEETFADTVWYRLARKIDGARHRPLAAVRLERLPLGERTALRVADDDGEELARDLDPSPARLRLLSRLGHPPEGMPDRAALLDRLALFQLTPEERAFEKAGLRSMRRTWEQSFWCRLAYHVVREFEGGPGASSGTFHPAVDEASGRFTLSWRRGGTCLVRVTVPREAVAGVLGLLAETFPGQEDLRIHPVPLKSLFQVRETTELDLEVRPVLRALQEGGEERFFEQEKFERFRYGRLVYLPALGVLAELERPGRERRFRAPTRMRLARSQVPKFLQEFSGAVAEGAVVLDEPLRRLKVFKDYDRLRLTPHASSGAYEDALGRRWTWLSVDYGFGTESVSLARLLEARRRGEPYVETAAGWVDLSTPAFRHLEALLAGQLEREAAGERLPLAAGEVLRLAAGAGAPVEVGGPKRRSAALRRLLDRRPRKPFHPPSGLISELRPYQQRGAEWLRFLWDQRLGGLLADDMGLGKTHQAMALFAGLIEEGETAGPFLVVCPTTVLPHWQAKIREHAPGLDAVVHHGLQRDLAAALGGETGEAPPGRVLLTSYGVLRRDFAELARVPFAVAVFDEAQELKNPDTLGHEAAAGLSAEIKLGLTGTPVENSLEDLEALFALVLPGYLEGVERRPGRNTVKPRGEVSSSLLPPAEEVAELRRLAAPFVLRRLKSAVLDELPEKFADVRTCSLSDDQVGLYREAVAGRGEELAAIIAAAAEPLPYIHIFALLNLLKRICDHPALALGELERAEEYASGKWDLFREVLGEALASGYKVVVFSQYLGMLSLMERHLDESGVGHVKLTGASRRRGEIVERFNRDEECRVFLGSLKAGGTGIDLVGGSVVVHYDRWWNAAREDQATDRVHRIGQKRAVQVVKLITEGTLEEKIAAVIDRKRRLAASVVQADDPSLAKIFTREELLELLSPPTSPAGRPAP